MDELLAFLNQGWVGVLIGALGVSFAIYQTIRRTGAGPVFQTAGQRLIEGDRGLLANEVTVQYEGQSIPRVSLTYVVLWNRGRAPIRAADVSQKDPIVFTFADDVRILKAELVKCTREANQSAVQIVGAGRSAVRYSFSFLDHMDGAVIRILHTGKKTTPHCSGTMIGVPRGVKSLGRFPAGVLQRTEERSTQLFARQVATRIGGLMILLGALGVILALFSNIIFDVGFLSADDIVSRILIAIASVLYAGTGFLAIWIGRRKFPPSLKIEE